MDSSKITQQPEKGTNQPTGNNPVSKAAESLKSAMQAHSANPGPAIPKDFNVQQEGTKEERKAKAQELNK